MMARRSPTLLAALTLPLIFGLLLVVVVLQEATGGPISRITGFGLAWGVATWFARARGISMATLGWVRPTLRSIAAGLVGGAGLVALVAGVLIATGGYEVSWQGAWGAYLGALVFAIPVGLYEEALFRSIWFGGLESIFGTWTTLALSAVLFGFLHAFNPGASLVSSIAIALTAGVLLGALFVAGRDLWLVAGVHTAWNATLGGFFGMPVSGNPFENAVLNATESGPDLWTGGSFGPEASLASVLIVGLVGGWFVVKARRTTIVPPRWRRGGRAVQPFG